MSACYPDHVVAAGRCGVVLLALTGVACSSKPVAKAPPPAEPVDATHFAIRSVVIAGVSKGPTDIEIRAGRIIKIGDVGQVPRQVDGQGRWVVPGFIDSHVHLALHPVSASLASWGVVAAVDMGAPEKFLETRDLELRRISSGPMITSKGGYPTQSWGADGYGFQCPNAMCARAAVARLKVHGAKLIKVPVGARGLPEKALRAASAQARQMGLRVAAHALTDSDANLAFRVGADILAHTPVSTLSKETLELWGRGTVVTTLAAFGADRQAAANLRALKAAGARILYGTDLGNTREAAINAKEIELMMAAGMTGKEIIAAGTSTPARFWDFVGLGAIEVGKVASFLVLDRDPLKSPQVLAKPTQVYIDGERRR